MLTTERTVALMFYTQHADLVKVESVDLWLTSKDKGYRIVADGFEVGVCLPMRKMADLGWACVLNCETPDVAELLTAPSRNDVIGLALRTAQEICAKAAFGSGG